MAFLNQPFENMQRLLGVDNAAVGGFTVDGGDIVFTGDSPVSIAGLSVDPPLDAGKQPLDSGPIGKDLVGEGFAIFYVSHPARTPPIIAIQHRHQIFGARQDKTVAFAAVQIAG